MFGKASTSCDVQAADQTQPENEVQQNGTHRKSASIHCDQKIILTPNPSGTDTSLASFGKRNRHICKCVISHSCTFKIIWDWIILLLVLYTSVQIPYMIAFYSTKGKRQQTVQSLLSIGPIEEFNGSATLIAFLVDLMFLLDILINFRTTYLHSETDEIVVNPKKIAIHYLKSWFCIDFIAAIPVDWFVSENTITDTEETATLFGLLKSARLLRLFRIARKIDRYSEYGIAVLFLLMSLFTLIAHWLACVWHEVGKRDAQSGTDYGWLGKRGWLGKLPNTTNGVFSKTEKKYIASLYFVMTSLTSVGFGNVSANTEYEQLFSIVVMLAGALMYASIFGNMVAIVQRLSSKATRFHNEMSTVREFLRCYKMPDNLRSSVQTYFRQEWTVNEGIDAQSVLRRLPESLQMDVCYELYQGMFGQVQAFRGATVSCMRALGKSFRTLHLQVGHYIIRKGDQVNKLFIIGKGSIEVMKDGDLVTLLAKNSMFGYDFLRRPQSPKSKVDMRAFNSVEVNFIEKEDLNDVFIAYPRFYKYFKQNFVQGCEICDEKEEGPKRPKEKRKKSATKVHVATIAKTALRMSFFRVQRSDKVSDSSESEPDFVDDSSFKEHPLDGEIVVNIPNGHTLRNNSLDFTDEDPITGDEVNQAHSSKLSPCSNLSVSNRINHLETRMDSIENELSSLRTSFDSQFRTVTQLLEEINRNVKASKDNGNRSEKRVTVADPNTGMITTKF